MRLKTYAIAGLLLCTGAFAQNGFILRTGLNIANSTFSPDLPSELDKSSRTGLELTGLVDLATSDQVHVLFGAGYENKGTRLSSGGDELAFNFDYLVFPIMLSFRSPSMGPQGPTQRGFLNLGVELAPLINSEAKFDGQSADINGVAGFDFGLRGEVGIEIPTASGAFILGGGYSYGLINTQGEGDEEDDEGSVETHNYVIKVFVGYKFGMASPAAAAPVR